MARPRTLKLLGALAVAFAFSLACVACSFEREPERGPEQPDFSVGTDSDDLDDAVGTIRTVTDFQPRVGIVLGSGLSGLAGHVDIVATVPYSDIAGFPIATADGHVGEYIFGYLEGVPVVLMNGRIHYYEGYDMRQVVLPVCVMGRLGVDAIILTNAVGSLNPDFKPGSLMCIDDHIASFVPSPLIGVNDPDLGERFVDMSEVYDRDLISIVHEAADLRGITVHDGVFLQVTGPNYETPAESRLYASLGADTVGMSTATEAIALHHMGVRVVGINCVTNVATVDHETVTSHEDVEDAAGKASDDMIALVTATVVRIGAEG